MPLIVVSGTGRSGTSMWMSLLQELGWRVVGERFPLAWEEHLAPANPEGFYESSLVAGINFTTHPDPATGARLEPAGAEPVAVKVLSHGLRRTERRFLGRVLFTVRDCAGFRASMRRLRALEARAGVQRGAAEPDPAVLWFLELLATLVDARQRGYEPVFVGFTDTHREPDAQLGRVLAMLDPEGCARLERLPAALGRLRAPRPAPPLDLPEALQPHAELLGSLDRRLVTGGLDGTPLDELFEVQRAMLELMGSERLRVEDW